MQAAFLFACLCLFADASGFTLQAQVPRRAHGSACRHRRVRSLPLMVRGLASWRGQEGVRCSGGQRQDRKVFGELMAMFARRPGAATRGLRW